ncbi:cytochrome P450 [Dendryphion nanum]|uniref:Cytochrome P450 n=1 Tax=Dendryphion nanum TaxID=256645 RepID=A0A9P9EIZ8_9PLEO|nr:cytochrome P450 [Dendryphion nanum]
MAYSPVLGLGGVTLLIVYILHLRHRRAAAARAHGCGVARKYRSKEPFLAFDLWMGMHMDLPIVHRLHQRIGQTFEARSWLAQPWVATIAPENIHAVHTGKDWGIQPMRLAGMEGFRGRGFLTTDGDIWSRSRKMMKPTFAKHNLVNFEFMNTQMDNMLREIEGKEGETFNIQPMFFTMFLHNSMDFLLGVDATKNSTDQPYTSAQFQNAFQDGLFLTMIRVVIGRAWKLLPKKKYITACNTAHKYIDYYVNQAFEEPQKSLQDNTNTGQRRSMVGELSRQTDERKYIRSQIMQGMMASQDTISALLGNMFFLLSRHPQYWEQVRDATLDRDVTDFTFDDLLNFKLVQNIILESLRIYPVFPLMSRTALQDTILPVGAGPNQNLPTFVPKGAFVVLSYYALHRNQDVFGADVENFRPERWDNINPSQWEFMGFGGGLRACLGRPKVLVEAAYVVVRLVKEFKLLQSRDPLEWKGDLRLTCKSANGCKIALFK